jgi:enamine deaminase RidA (YjgF/YER057c/UK114 family)
MTENVVDPVKDLFQLENLSDAERDELIALGILSTLGTPLGVEPTSHAPGYSSVERQGISAHSVLNEACDYGSAFSRGLRLELGKYTLLMISGTASIDGNGDTVYKGDFRAQCWRTYRNITTLLESEGATWKDIIKTTCYLRDIERDYDEFNRVRNAFYRWNELDPLPASVGIQARLCREDLLIEIEAIAILKKI